MNMLKTLGVAVFVLILLSAGKFRSFEETVFSRPAESGSDNIIEHKDYTISYSENYKQAKWVAYKVQSKRNFNPGKNNVRSIQNNPFLDPALTPKLSDCEYSGFVAAQLFPAECAMSGKSEKESFYISNVSPQFSGFHQNVWLRLNKQIAQWAGQGNEIYVITAGILSDNLLQIGINQWAIPDHFYKIVLLKNGNNLKMIGFLLPHYNNNLPLSSYVTDVDHIESLAGINFFPELPDDIEDALEAGVRLEEWDFSEMEDQKGFQIAQK